MALSKENTVGLNQPDIFVSEAIEEGADPQSTPIEPLVDLLLDLLFEEPQKSASEAVSDREAIASDAEEFEELANGKIEVQNLEEVAIEPPQHNPSDDNLCEIKKESSSKTWLGSSKKLSVLVEESSLNPVVDVSAITVEHWSSTAPRAELEKPMEAESVVNREELVEKPPSLRITQEETSELVEEKSANSGVENSHKNLESLLNGLLFGNEEVEKTREEKLIVNCEEVVKRTPSLQKSQEETSELVEEKSANLGVESSNKNLENLVIPPPVEVGESVVSNSGEVVEDPLDALRGLVMGSALSDIKNMKNLLAESELPEVRQMMTIIEDKVASLEHQIYAPQELMNLMLPWVADLLSMKVSQAREEVAKAIAPIVDLAIQKKVEEDKLSIILTLAPLLPEAIAAQIRNSPNEIAQALGPEIAAAIQEQIRVSRDDLAEALAPIVDQMIENKSQQDKGGIIAAIAPLLPSALAAQIRKYPDEVAKALGPEIAAAVTEQIRLSRDSMIEAMAPIVDKMIENKTKEDKSGIIAAIAPLLPDAIAAQIRNCPEDIAKAIGPEVAAAMREQIRVDRDSIAEALAPEMGRAIKAQISLERDAMVDALYPVIGNTISKYMVEAIRTINEKVSNAFSLEGMQRKVRAKVQGVSEGELILKESIPFTVQAVFLIHKASGLIISEVQHSGRERLESEMVAGMLTAIRSFVNECIVQSGETSELNLIEYGASQIVLEVAGYCYLAVVMKAEPPKQFIEQMRRTLSTIILKYGKLIEAFEGDTFIIPGAVQSLLENLLDFANDRKKPEKPPVALIGLSVAVLSLIAVPWGFYQYRLVMDRRIAGEVGLALASVPELSVYQLNASLENNKLKLTGRLPNQKLRAKAETIAKVTGPEMPLENQIIVVDVPPDPVLAAAEVKRVTSLLNQMENVSISSQYEDRKVTVEGTVMQIADSQKIAESFKKIPGVQSVISTVKLNPVTIRTRIYFDPGSVLLNPAYGDSLDNIQAFLKQYPNKQLKIIGHSDRDGSFATNQKLALQRAEVVKEALIKRGVDPKRLQVIASPTPPQDVEPNQPLLLSRCVIFEPIINSIKSKK